MKVPVLLAASITMLPSRTSIFLPSRVISIIAWRLDVVRHNAALVLDVMQEFVVVVLDEGAHRHGRRVAQRADGAALDVVGHRIEQIEVLKTALTVLDAVDHAIQPAG